MRRSMLALGRMLLAGIFVHGGWHSFREPGGRADRAAKLGLPNAELAVRANGLGMVVAGSTFGLGILPRLSAAALIGMLMPTTLAGHRFWEESTPQGRRAQETQFLKNLGLLGGLLFFLAAAGRRARS